MGEFFAVFEDLADTKHDVSVEGANLILDYLSRCPVPADEQVRRDARGACIRANARIARLIRPISEYPGFEMIVDSLTSFRDALE